MNIFRAASLGNIEIIKKIISSGVDVNCLDEENFPALAYAKNAEVASILIESGAYVSGFGGEVPITHKLIERVSTGKSEISALFIVANHDSGINSDWNGLNGDYAIHAAARTGNENIIKTIVSAGGDLNLLSNDGESAYGLVAELNNELLLQLMIELSETPPTNEYFYVNTSVIDSDEAERIIEHSFSLVDWAFKLGKKNILQKLERIGVYPTSSEENLYVKSNIFFLKEPSSYPITHFTKWFPISVCPFHEGIYEVTPDPDLILGRKLYAFWRTSSGWSNATPNPNELLDELMFQNRAWYWRGLKSPPKSS